MATQPQFLIDFQDRMDRLASVRQNITASIDLKTQFTNNLKTKLAEINQRIQDLGNLIDQLKTASDNLQGQVNANNTSITDKDRQIIDLNNEVQRLTAQQQVIEQTCQEQKDALQNEIYQRQQQIDKLEQQLRDLTAQKTALDNKVQDLTAQKTAVDNQVQALQTELQNRGDPNQHAQEIARLTQENQDQLQQQRQLLINEIDQRQKRIDQLEQQIIAKDNELQQQRQQINDQQNQVQGQIQGLQNQINDLTALNNTITQRLIDATQAINQAADDLEMLMNSVPNIQTQQDVTALIGEIERSIQAISNAAQGQPPRNQGQATRPPPRNQGQAARPPPRNQGQAARPPPNIPGDTVIMVPDRSPNSPYNFRIRKTYSEIKDSLREKANQIPEGRENKYQNALNELNNAQTPDNVLEILSRNNINWKSNKFMGGKKTKKNRKQKGGFIYKVTSRRRQISSSLPKLSKRASSGRSRRSSR